MLVLTRKAGESIRIGDIVIQLVQVTGGRVRVGIDAPRDVRILRTELESREHSLAAFNPLAPRIAG